MKNRVLAIIPARGGSKGVPRKNIRKLNGKYLIEYTIDAAKNSKNIDRVIVSTEDSEIADIALKYGAEIPYLRPIELAGDSSNVIDSILHVIEYLNIDDGYEPEYVILLQPTSPLRNSVHIDEAIEKLISSKFDGIISVCESEVNPYWTNIFIKDKLEYFIKDGKNITRRQDLPNSYRYNGAIFLVKTEVLKREKTFEVENLTGYIMSKYYSVDIDTEFDFELAKFMINLNSRLT